MMKPPIGVGFLSFAHGHVSLYAQVMKDFPDARLVAAYDDDESRGRAVCEPLGMRYTTKPEDVLKDPAVHAVIIGSETSNHESLTVAALRAGKRSTRPRRTAPRPPATRPRPAFLRTRPTARGPP